MATQTAPKQVEKSEEFKEKVRELGIQVFLSSTSAGLGMQPFQCFAVAEELLTAEIRLQK